MSKRNAKPESLPDLSPLELEVMGIIWSLGECTSAEVIDAYNRKRPLANTTIRTVISNIRRKGYIETVSSVEPRIHFRPLVSKRAVARRTVRQLLSNMFGGSPRQAIQFLLEEESMDERELDEIRRLIESQSGDGDAK